jgi:inosine-uridine nucleoside N-ribohydrolase
MRRRDDVLAARQKAASALALVLAAGCDGTLDAGRNSQGLLPVDKHNPVIITNDASSDNWAGEYAILMANSGALTLVGIVVDASSYWPDQTKNATGWNDLVAAARGSHLKGVPDITLGANAPLAVPADQKIDDTPSLNSDGGKLIVKLSRELSLPGQPLVVVTGAQLTDLADAYLMDHSVVERVTVVSSLGGTSSPKILMTGPNGDLDPWADYIVAQKFHYIQVTVLYDQAGDVTADDLANLPANSFGDWIKAKQPNLSTLNTATDQVAILAVGLPTFVTTAGFYMPDPAFQFGSPQGQGPPLVPSPTGNAQVVTQVDGTLVRTQLWKMLETPGIFGP